MERKLITEDQVHLGEVLYFESPDAFRSNREFRYRDNGTEWTLYYSDLEGSEQMLLDDMIEGGWLQPTRRK